jgi:predicted Rossmann fold nucleotide-binding protein DprA/Smf involved in DNA uptake
MKIIIAGTRTFDNKQLLFNSMNVIIEKLDLHYFEVISGTAEGADKLGEECEKYIVKADIPGDKE